MASTTGRKVTRGAKGAKGYPKIVLIRVDSKAAHESLRKYVQGGGGDARMKAERLVRIIPMGISGVC